MTRAAPPRNLGAMTRTFFALGAAFGFLGVALGAMGAHALSTRLAPDRLAIYEVGVRYQVYHALALLAVAWACERFGAPAGAAGWAFVAGILIFSGSLYALAFGAPRWFGAITPIGGLCFLAGWLLLVVAALRA